MLLLIGRNCDGADSYRTLEQALFSFPRKISYFRINWTFRVLFFFFFVYSATPLLRVLFELRWPILNNFRNVFINTKATEVFRFERSSFVLFNISCARINSMVYSILTKSDMTSEFCHNRIHYRIYYILLLSEVSKSIIFFPGNTNSPISRDEKYNYTKGLWIVMNLIFKYRYKYFIIFNFCFESDVIQNIWFSENAFLIVLNIYDDHI